MNDPGEGCLPCERRDVKWTPPRCSLRSPRVLPLASCSSGGKAAFLRAGRGAVTGCIAAG